MARYISVTDTAKLIRASLKRSFPGVKFSVRSSSYAGGASINVGWTDGPEEQAVNSLVKKFEGASFDAMIDLKSYKSAVVSNPDGTAEEVHYGSDYVFTRRRISSEA